MDTLIKNLPLPITLSSQLLIGLGMLLMAIEPLIWLINSWLDPAHDSQGGWVFLLCLGLFVWSLFSLNTASYGYQSRNKALLLLFSTALLRAVSQVCAINVLGAIALSVDVYALSLLADLNHRKNAISAGWLAVLFTFSLPVERILQRLLGFTLQHLSADGACMVLQGVFADVQCFGIRILLAGRDVLVDLPCSGVRSITLLCLLYVTLMCVVRPSGLRSLLIGVFTLASALVANVLRISFLATFIAYPEKISGINVMMQPYHDLIGLICLLIAALPLVLLTVNTHKRIYVKNYFFIHTKYSSFFDSTHNKFMRNQPWFAFGFVLLAFVIVLLPRKPFDASNNYSALTLPIYLQGHYGQSIALTTKEQNYFTQYGGAAVKVRYGDNSALLVRTHSPLRHLHTPDDCLRGLGFQVAYQGVQYQSIPTAIYLATAKNGSQWRVAVSFYSDSGQFTSNVSEAVWLWLQQPKQTWYALQRITPIYVSEAKAKQWDNALFTALDLSNQEIRHVKFN